jgi:hypothetical protein
MADVDPKQARSDARAEAAAAKARAKSMRPWYRKKRIILPLALLVVIVLAMATSGGSDDDSGDDQKVASTGSNPAEKDVTIDSCEADEFGYMQAQITIKNNSSKRSNYLGSINFEDPSGTKIAESGFISNNIDPDQSAKEEAGTGQKAVDGFTCKVTDVTRLASN